MDSRIPNSIRFLSIDAVEKANSGHPGMPMGMADVATILFHEYLKFDASKPSWPNRDRVEGSKSLKIKSSIETDIMLAKTKFLIVIFLYFLKK